jgi:hypothetical protein
MADPDFNKLLVEECAKAIYEVAPVCETPTEDAPSRLASLPWDACPEGFRRPYRDKARACLAKAADLTFSHTTSDNPAKLTAQALRAAGDPENWRP